VIVPLLPSVTLPERDGVWAATCADVVVLQALAMVVGDLVGHPGQSSGYYRGFLPRRARLRPRLAKTGAPCGTEATRRVLRPIAGVCQPLTQSDTLQLKVAGRVFDCGAACLQPIM
jgi:hypothetical protein